MPEIDAKRAEAAVRELLIAVGEDPDREGLLDTPSRVTRMWSELLSGMSDDPSRHLERTFEIDHDEMVMVRDIEFTSMCEHHMLPFIGKAHVAYISSGKVIGLSKLNRLVEYFSKRPQVQERLTMQIGKALQTVLQTQDVAVFMDAKHLCVASRGVKDDSSNTITGFYGGKFQEENTKAEFLKYLDINA